MPVSLPIRRAPMRRLSWPDATRLVVLVVRLRFLDLQAHALVRGGAGLADDRLLRLMRKWLACHEAISALLPGIPEHERVRQVWVVSAHPALSGSLKTVPQNRAATDETL